MLPLQSDWYRQDSGPDVISNLLRHGPRDYLHVAVIDLDYTGLRYKQEEAFVVGSDVFLSGWLHNS